MSKNNDAVNFWDKVNFNPDKRKCWEWLGKYKNGYGYCYSKGWKLAHRYSFYLVNKFYPDCVCHSCDNKKCVNPHHLWAGNRTLNNLDRDKKGRHRTNPLKGIDSPMAILKESDVLFIREQYKIIKSKDLAEMFNVSRQNICDIQKGRTWKHI